jgi:hypothetical protein
LEDHCEEDSGSGREEVEAGIRDGFNTFDGNMCRASGASRLFEWHPQRSRAGLTSDAPPALDEKKRRGVRGVGKLKIFPCRVHKKN